MAQKVDASNNLLNGRINDVNEYIYRINKVLNYIQEHIDEDLSLEELSAVASFSPYHFHRLFKKRVGVNLNYYIKRERVERAAKMLVINYEESLTNIALNVGFSSTSVFARAFKEHFGMSATQYRKEYHNSKFCKLNSNNEKAFDSFFRYDHKYQMAADNQITEGCMKMDVQVKTLEGVRVAYVRLQGYEAGQFSHKIDSAFNKTRNWLDARGLISNETMCMGIFYDHTSITPNEMRRYDAAVTIPKHIQMGSVGVDIQDVPDGQYATCRVEVNQAEESARNDVMEKLDHAFQFIMEDWIHQNGYQLEDKPCLEVYVSTSPNIVMEAYVPISPK